MSKYAYFKSNQEKDIDLKDLKSRCAGHHVFEQNYYVDSSENMPQFRKMLEKLNFGDTVIIDTLSSLGHNNIEISENWNILRQKRHVNIVVLDEPYLDTKIKCEDLSGEYIADLIMGTFTRTSEATNSIRKKRQMRGIKEAKKKGTRFGTARKELPETFEQYARMYLEREMTLREAAEKVGIPKSTFAYRARKMAEEEGGK